MWIFHKHLWKGVVGDYAGHVGHQFILQCGQ
jgi:hypothetical protein